MAIPADQLIDHLLDRVATAWVAEGERAVSDVRVDLDQPAQVAIGPRGGRRLIGARPGQFPRKRTGQLQAGVTAAVARGDDDVTLTIDDPVAHATYLQDAGYVVTSNLPDELVGPLAEAAVDAINAD